MKNNDKQLTSVKIDPELFEEFNVFKVRTKFTLQKLVERSVFLYLKDENFRNKIHNTLNIQLSGSQTIISSSLLQ